MNKELAQRVVDLAKETIQYLSLLNTSTDVYRRIQVFYHHFLTSAIACLFLASAHAPMLFSAQCREEFNMSMVLIEDMSAKSHVSQRLWSTIKELKAYAPILGLQDANPRLRESAALTMAGMARMSRGGQAPSDQLLISDRHGSISSASAGYQPTPSPGVTPGLGGQNYPPSRMGSLTPHAGGHSPQTGGVGSAQGQDFAAPNGETPKNGLLLRTEMSKMFEALSNGMGYGAQLGGGGGGGDGSFNGSPNEYSAGGHWMPYPDDGVYPRMKMMF